ncbi:MAG: hypothetical protein K2P81_17375 [Bacteriovoracaceae bacterium]|nr:hypothetical protein [Bacteriovoracaceae bacterium]
MKYLILTCLITANAFAGLKFSFERSTPSGSDRFEIENKSSEVIIHKTSNWFDKKEDLRLGDFKSQNPSSLKSVQAELEQIEEQLKKANDKLTAYGTTFNDLNSKSSLHSPYFKVNDFKVQKGSTLYPKLEQIFTKLQQTPLTLVNGVELDSTKKNYIFYENSKETGREPFNVRFFCEQPRFPTRCMARKWGTLYLE